MQFGAHLRALRRAAGLTQEELADRAGLTANGVSALERGARTRPYPHTVRSLADALGVASEERRRLMAAATRATDDDGLVAGAAVVPEQRTTAASTAGALPLAPTALVGRDHDVAAIRSLAARPGVRLITLVGTAGVGKSRLALEVIRETEGASFVALASLTDPSLVPSLIAATLGLPDASGLGASALVEALRDRRGILVLDNFEHLLAAAPFVADVLAGCPELTVVATSRAPLKIRGEREFLVAPLDLPSGSHDPDPTDVTASPAGHLFLDRARAVLPRFDVTADNARDVAAICRRLGGLPLALELAAAKVKLLAPRDLLARLDAALSVGWSRDLPRRQRTMRATLDWSYQLLTLDEQTLFRHLGLFAGPFRLDAAEALVGRTLDRDQVLGLMNGLVEQSLLTVTHSAGDGARYTLLEPVRQYAAALLAEQHETLVGGRALTAYYVAFIEQAAPEYWGPDQVRWLRRTEEEAANIRVAISGALSRDDGETAARMCWGMWPAWWISGRFGEGQRWVSRALRLSLSPFARSRALLVGAVACYVRSSFDDALEWWGQAGDCARAAGDAIGVAYAEAGRGLALLSLGRSSEAEQAFREGLRIACEQGEEGLATLTRTWLGTLLLASGDASGSVAVSEPAIATARRRGDRLVAYAGMFNLATGFLALGNKGRAEALFRESVSLSHESGDAANLAFALDGLAVIEGRRGNAYRSALLLGAAEAMRQASEGRVYHYYLADDALRERTRRQAEAALGEDDFTAAWSAGLRMDFSAAAAAAHPEWDREPVTAGSSPAQGGPSVSA
jgi:predicted ATPase/transcriptional regulator with XRE-family HTH domain